MGFDIGSLVVGFLAGAITLAVIAYNSNWFGIHPKK